MGREVALASAPSDSHRDLGERGSRAERTLSGSVLDTWRHGPATHTAATGPHCEPRFRPPETFRADAPRLAAPRKGPAHCCFVRGSARLCQLSFSRGCIFSGPSSRQREPTHQPGPAGQWGGQLCAREPGPGLQSSERLPAVSLTPPNRTSCVRAAWWGPSPCLLERDAWRKLVTSESCPERAQVRSPRPGNK